MTVMLRLGRRPEVSTASSEESAKGALIHNLKVPGKPLRHRDL